MGKMTPAAYNVQVTAHLAECLRVGAVMTDGGILSHYLTSLDSTRFREVFAEVNTKRTMHAEYHGDQQELATRMDTHILKQGLCQFQGVRQ